MTSGRIMEGGVGPGDRSRTPRAFALPPARAGGSPLGVGAVPEAELAAGGDEAVAVAGRR